MYRGLFICQLSIEKQFILYKAIKSFLISENLFTTENLYNAMCCRIWDLEENINLDKLGF